MDATISAALPDFSHPPPPIPQNFVPQQHPLIYASGTVHPPSDIFSSHQYHPPPHPAATNLLPLHNAPPSIVPDPFIGPPSSVLSTVPMQQQQAPVPSLYDNARVMTETSATTTTIQHSGKYVGAIQQQQHGNGLAMRTLRFKPYSIGNRNIPSFGKSLLVCSFYYKKKI